MIDHIIRNLEQGDDNFAEKLMRTYAKDLSKDEIVALKGEDLQFILESFADKIKWIAIVKGDSK
jgi:hypothetical protein